MRDVKRPRRREACYLSSATHSLRALAPSRAERPAVSTFLIQIAFLAAGAAYFGWTAVVALRSGEISVYVRANRDRYFSRRANPGGYWIAVSWYLVLAMVAPAGIVIRCLWR